MSQSVGIRVLFNHMANVFTNGTRYVANVIALTKTHFHRQNLIYEFTELTFPNFFQSVLILLQKLFVLNLFCFVCFRWLCLFRCSFFFLRFFSTHTPKENRLGIEKSTNSKSDLKIRCVFFEVELNPLQRKTIAIEKKKTICFEQRCLLRLNDLLRLQFVCWRLSAIFSGVLELKIMNALLKTISRDSGYVQLSKRTEEYRKWSEIVRRCERCKGVHQRQWHIPFVIFVSIFSFFGFFF